MSEEADAARERRFAAVLRLGELGFRPLGAMMFMKDEVAYDLSTADLTQIDQIEREGRFVIPAEEVHGRILAIGRSRKELA